VVNDIQPDIRLIALDLDGTLLDSKKHISDRNRRALAAAAQAGIYVVPCSGRALNSIPQEVLQLQGVRYVVTSGGGAVYDLTDRRLLDICPLPANAVQQILKYCYATGAMGECYTGEKAISEPATIARMKELVKHRDFAFLERTPTEHLIQWVQENPHQVVKLNLMFRDPALRLALRDWLSARGDILLTSASALNLEVNTLGVGKGGMLHRLGRILGVAPVQMMACGDQLNDRPMLQAVGFPVAMGNAVPEIKALAKYITATNDEDGVAQVVEKLTQKKPG